MEARVVECCEELSFLGHEKRALGEALDEVMAECSSHKSRIANLRMQIESSKIKRADLTGAADGTSFVGVVYVSN